MDGAEGRDDPDDLNADSGLTGVCSVQPSIRMQNMLLVTMRVARAKRIRHDTCFMVITTIRVRPDEAAYMYKRE
jgi:hypothetical protein